MRGLLYTSQFQKDAKRVPPEYSGRIEDVLLKLRLHPHHPALNIKKLRMFPDLWRVRIGEYRLAYSYDEKNITLVRVRHRKEMYRNL